MQLVASWSKDPSTKVGAVIIPKDSDVPIIGWNGFPRKVKDKKKRYADRNIKYEIVCHAEENAILNAAKHGICLDGAKIYISHPPCNRCSKLIANSGIKKVIYKDVKKEEKIRWEKISNFSNLIFRESGVKIVVYEAD